MQYSSWITHLPALTGLLVEVRRWYSASAACRPPALTLPIRMLLFWPALGGPTLAKQLNSAAWGQHWPGPG